MPLTCSICATASPDDARFCRGCGAALKGSTVAPSALPITAVPCPVCRHPNRSGTRFCAKCGRDQFAAPATPAPPPPPPTAPTPAPAPAAQAVPLVSPMPPAPRGMLWLATGALALVLAAAAWWLLAPSHGRAGRGPSPVADGTAGTPAGIAPPAAVSLAQATSPATAASVPAAPLTPAELWDPIPPEELQAARDQAAKLRVAREAKALAAREQAALAETDAARRPTDEAQARMPAAAPPLAGATQRSALPAPTAASPAGAGTVQQACGNRNLFSQAICESRECSRAEHANEDICKRVRAAQEQRRDPQ